MARTKRLIKSFYGLLLPIAVLIILATAIASVWLVHDSAAAPKSAYLVTPEKYGRLSTRGARVTDENWANRDGTTARGWLLRGSPNAPAVILLHRYGADRSWVLDLGVKINEATDFTVLMPDVRGHGANPPVEKTSFGGCEADDVLAAMEFLRGLKIDERNALVGKDFGVYGVELGAFAGLIASAKDENIKALALDSVPLASNDLLASVVGKHFPFASSMTSKIAGGGTYLYYFNGCYNHSSACSAAKAVTNRKILLLAGGDTPNYQNSTTQLKICFPDENIIEAKLDLTSSGFGINNASLEQAEMYDQRVIEFFKRSLMNEQPETEDER